MWLFAEEIIMILRKDLFMIIQDAPIYEMTPHVRTELLFMAEGKGNKTCLLTCDWNGCLGFISRDLEHDSHFEGQTKSIDTDLFCNIVKNIIDDMNIHSSLHGNAWILY